MHLIYENDCLHIKSLHPLYDIMISGFLIVILIFAARSIDEDFLTITLHLGGPLLIFIAIAAIPSTHAIIDIENDSITVSNLLFNCMPITRVLKISDITVLRVLRRSIYKSGYSDALQIVEMGGRKTNIGHFKGYLGGRYQRVVDGSIEIVHSEPNLFGEVIDFIQTSLKSRNLNTKLVGGTIIN